MTAAALARELARARAEARVLDVAPWRDLVRSMDDAYAVQSELAKLPGNAVRGWKVTALTPEQQRGFDSNRPVAGALFDGYVHRAPATLTLSRFIATVIECEISFRLSRDLPQRNAPYTDAEIADAIDAIVPCYEFPDNRVPADAPDLMKLADDMGNGAFVPGEPVTDWRTIDLSQIEIVLTHDGAEIARGPAARILGNPLKAVTALANAQPLPAGGLKAGQIVTTGTCTTPLPLQRGEYVADFGVLGSVKLSVT
jgi:2-keto-4-pentenoate hydratase